MACAPPADMCRVQPAIIANGYIRSRSHTQTTYMRILGVLLVNINTKNTKKHTHQSLLKKTHTNHCRFVSYQFPLGLDFYAKSEMSGTSSIFLEVLYIYNLHLSYRCKQGYETRIYLKIWPPFCTFVPFILFMCVHIFFLCTQKCEFKTISVSDTLTTVVLRLIIQIDRAWS